MRFENQMPGGPMSFTLAPQSDETACDPQTARRSIRAAMSRIAGLVGDGLTGYGESVYPSFFGLYEYSPLLDLLQPERSSHHWEYRDRDETSRSREMPADHDDDDARLHQPDDLTRSEDEPTDALGWCARLMSPLSRLWSSVRQAHRRRQTRLKLDSLDDWTLRDIAVPRWRIDYFSGLDYLARHDDIG